MVNQKIIKNKQKQKQKQKPKQKQKQKTYRTIHIYTDYTYE